jgi:hypothetical protein
MAIIPRIIHQTWKSNAVPPGLAEYQRTWRDLHSGFEYRLWTDADNDDLVAQHFPELMRLYRSFAHGVHRADLARCLYLLRFGGIYADLDVQAVRHCGDLLESGGSCFFGSEPEVHARRLRGRTRFACNAVMASVPGHPFWRELVAEIARRAAAKGPSADPVWLTGPEALHDVWERHGDGLGVRLLAPSVFFPLPDVYNGRLGLDRRAVLHYRRMVALGCYPADTVAVHHWEHTWIVEQPARRALRRAVARARAVHEVVSGEKTIDEVLRAGRYGVAFPEHAFPPRAERVRAYTERVAEGRDRASRASLAVLVLLRDRVDLALLLRARLERMARLFGAAQVFVKCDDSNDGTAEVMTDWRRARPELVTLVEGRVSPSPSPFARLARLRNSVIDRLENEPLRDFVVVLDGDLEGPVSLDGLLHSVALLTADDGPHAAAAYGVNNWVGLERTMPFLGYSYYDPLALREREWAAVHGDARIRLRLAGVRRGDPPLAVKSAFAGMSIYRGAIIRGLRYEPDAHDCEHVGFHRGLAERGGRLVLNPSMLLLAGRQGHHREAPSQLHAASQLRPMGAACTRFD